MPSPFSDDDAYASLTSSVQVPLGFESVFNKTGGANGRQPAARERVRDGDAVRGFVPDVARIVTRGV